MSTPESTISVNRLLTRITHTEKQWTQDITQSYGHVFKDAKSVSDSRPQEDVMAEVEKNLQSTRDRIAAHFQHRCAINASNQITKITVGDREFTIADALIYKQHILPLEKAYLNELRKQIDVNKRLYAGEYDRWDKLIADKDADTIEALRKTLQPSVVLPIDTYTKLDDWIKLFERELSAALSDQNSLTQIAL